MPLGLWVSHGDPSLGAFLGRGRTLTRWVQPPRDGGAWPMWRWPCPGLRKPFGVPR